jgi:5'-3' exonuclease
LQKDDTCTGVVFGVLSRLLSIGTRFRTNDFHFCFDCPTDQGIRRASYPPYKAHRTAITDEEKEEKRLLFCQIQLLRDTVAAIGWPCYEVERFESDDIIASLVVQYQHQEDVIIVSSDGDLHQLMGSSRVRMFNPTKHTIISERDLPYKASEVVMLKAIGGCSSDEVKGVPSVAATRALQYIRGEYTSFPVPKWVTAIEAAGHIINRNRALVELPHLAMPSIRRQTPALSVEMFQQQCKALGFESFLGGKVAEQWMKLLEGDFNELAAKSTAPMGRISQRRRASEQIEGFGL